MNELQLRLSRVLMRGLDEHARLAALPDPPFEILDDLADTMEKMPRLVYDWRRTSLPALDEAFGGHRARHPGCTHDYRAFYADIRVPDWQVWNHRRVRDEALRGDARLNEAQAYLLAVALCLFKATHTAAWGRDHARMTELGQLARRIPALEKVDTLATVEALAGPTGPWADAGCSLWMVFQPLTAPLDGVVMKYLR